MNEHGILLEACTRVHVPTIATTIVSLNEEVSSLRMHAMRKVHLSAVHALSVKDMRFQTRLDRTAPGKQEK